MNIKIFSGSSHPEFTRQICEQLGLTVGQAHGLAFSNDNRFIKIDEAVRGCDTFVVQTSCPPVDAHLMEMLMMIRALRGASAGRITAVLPYLPYSRSDKKDQERICLTARLIADLIESAGADHVLIMEMHSPQIQGFFSVPCDHLVAAPTLIAHLKQTWNLENYVLVAGDAGAAKILKLYADGLHLPVAIMDKRRDANDEQPKIKGVIGEVTGKKCLLVDDEIASGRTLIRDAEFLLKSAGATEVSACVTHPVLGGNAVAELNASPIARFVITDTIPLGAKKLKNTEVVSVVPAFAECIRRIHENESIKSLNDV
ncbi:MAG: ribose-phosphate pyrophosphokinase [Candidatus Magasanikbacteria bacterium]|jgi:ribose-phosphate pyrophosphokinase